MTDYRLSKKPDGTIEFWTNDKELRSRVTQNIEDIVDAISFRRQIQRIDKRATFVTDDEE